MWFTDDITGARELSVKVWYPAKDNQFAKKALYVDNQELLSEALSKSLGVPRALMKRADGIKVTHG